MSGLWRKAIELAARWYVFIFLNVYGTGKIHGGQFYLHGHLPPDVAHATLGGAGPFELAWTFMGYSFAYILFIGVAEILGACLLLGEKTKLLGVAILLPVMVNILVFDLIFLDKYGALASAAIYTTLLFVILALNGEKVKQSFQALVRRAHSEPETRQARMKIVFAALALMGTLFVFDHALVKFFGYGRG